MLAISRLVLDNFRHVKAFWIKVGLKLAQISLAFGVDDLDGTVVEEKISHAAGVDTGQAIERDELVPGHPGGRPRAGRTRHALQRGAALRRQWLSLSACRGRASAESIS